MTEDDVSNKEDALVVLLMGSVADRALGAADLYDEGVAGNILMVRSYLAVSDILAEKGIFVPGDAERSEQVLLQLGVSEDDLIILDGAAESTKDEAIVVRDYLATKPEIEEIIIVTSKFHSSRSKLIFNKALSDLAVDVYSSPTPYDPFQPRGWYKDKEHIQRVLSEYVKLVNYFLIEQFIIR